MRVIPVETERPYEVFISADLLEGCGDLVRRVHKPCRVGLVTDSNVDRIYLNLVQTSLEQFGFRCAPFVFPAGEASKNLTTYGEMLCFFAEEQLTRGDLIVALGGGVTGDMAGFAAATYLRGLPWVQIPTTLLAAVDASVGGKTAVDLPNGKNLVGCFHQPLQVIFDCDCLDTLEQEQFQDGLAEMIKHGAIADGDLFRRMSQPFRKDSPDLEQVIARNVEIKRSFVLEDERDQGQRQLLNFGHTIGHGIEKCSGYQISHGQAVAMGMVAEAKAARCMGLSDVHEDQIKAVLEQHNLPWHCTYGPDVVYQAALGDKKRLGDQMHVVTLLETGKAGLATLSMTDFHRFVALGLED